MAVRSCTRAILIFAQKPVPTIEPMKLIQTIVLKGVRNEKISSKENFAFS